MGAVHELFWPPILELLALDTEATRAGARPRPLEGATVTARARPRPARAGGRDRRRRGRPRRAARRRAGPDRAAQPGAQRRRRDLPRALARDARRRARGAAARRPGRDQGRVAAALARAALRRRRADGARPRRASPAPTAPCATPAPSIVGVGNMHELGAGSTGNVSVYGPARNPWDTERCPGGSSSGPAAAVAGRLVAGAVGADGLGSIRFPAAYCGLTGLKPTFGRSAMEGHHMARGHDADRLRPALRRRRRLPPARLGALRRGARRRRRRRPADRRRPRRRLRGRHPRGAARPARRRSRRCARRPAARSARSRCPTSTRRPWPAILIINTESMGGVTPERLNHLDPELSPIDRGFAQVPDAAAGRRDGPGRPGCGR